MSTQDEEFEVIQPPDTLKSKVSYSATGVDLAMLEKAEQIIAGLQGSYLEWVEEDLAKLQSFYDQLQARPGESAALLKEIFRVAHDVKGQGGSFGYDLMTVVGNHLCRFVEGLTEVGDAEREVIRLHLDALRLIINERLEGTGGAAGDKMVSGLQAVIAKVGKRA